jgi:hypothetical protein
MQPHEQALIAAALAFDVDPNDVTREALRVAVIAYRQEAPTLTRRVSTSHFRAVTEELEKGKG